MWFGRYQLLDKLAVGGMAELFLAKSVGEAGFERVCVVKRVLPHLAESADFVNMFLEEGRIAARLHHPGVVQIFDLGREGEHYYLAMEYLPGEDLVEVLRQTRSKGQRVPLEVAAAVIARAAAALHFVHELKDDGGRPLGIVHRDISPSNLMVTYQGLVKVLDFGIARVNSRREVTAAGQLKGKLAYLAPEQIRGHPADRRADIWALGVCLYELFSGETLFRATPGQNLWKQVVEMPIAPLRTLRPELPPALESLVARCLERDPAERLATAELLQLELEAFLAQRTGSPMGPALGRYLLELFGPERANAKQQRAFAGGRQQTGAPRPGTQQLEAGTGVVASSAQFEVTAAARSARPDRALTELVGAAPPESPRAPSRASGIAIGLLAVGALGAGALLYSRQARPPIAEKAPAPLTAAPGEAAPLPVSSEVVTVTSVPPPEKPASEEPTGEGQKTAAVKPVRRTGTVRVESNLKVTVFEGARALGVTPCELTLSVGSHALRLVGQREKVLKTARVNVRAGVSQRLDVNFGKGRLNVDAVPWADVFLDGAPLGQTPLKGIQVWDGMHALRLVAPQGERPLQVEVVAGETKSIRVHVP